MFRHINKNSWVLALSIVIGSFAVVGFVSAATTISTDISTGGLLSVTGISTLLGNVSIGTTTAPSVALHIRPAGNISPGMRLEASNGDSIFFWSDGVDRAGIIGAYNYVDGSSGKPLYLNTNGGFTDSYGIVAVNNNFGIGTSTPYSRLHVTSGANATTTVTIGEIGVASSKACVNMKRSDGGAGSFYINGQGQGIFEANYCK